MKPQVPIWLDRAVAVILFITLALGLVLPKVAGAGYLLCGLIAMVWLSVDRSWQLRELWPLERLMLLAVALFVGVWLLGWIGHGLHQTGTDGVGRILRLLLIIPLLLFFRRLDRIEYAWWHGLTAGAVIAGCYAWWFLLTGQVGELERRVGGVTNPIYFGGIALAIGLMLLPRLQDVRLSGIQRTLAALAILLALSASALSGSRGAWLALPPLLILYLFTLGANQPLRWRVGVPAALALITLTVMLSPLTPMGARAAAGLGEFMAMVNSQPPDGTIGRRLDLWQVAREVILARPVVGSGPGGFRQALELAVAEGRMGEHLLAYQHPHNQYLSAWIHAGLAGLASLILMVAIALRRLTQIWKTGLLATRHLGWSGLAGLITLAAMALSESLFERNLGIVWFGLFTALAVGLVQVCRRRELARTGIRRCHTLSVIVICKNEERNIARCLKSVSGWADEIIVLDSGSTDRTVEIARQFTPHVEQTDWPGFGLQKQHALDRARGDWVLSLDADEAVGDDVRDEIDHVLTRALPIHHGYCLPWVTVAFGRELSFGHWARAPLRLFQRDRGRFTPNLVHEKVVLAPGSRTGYLEGRLHHHVYRDLDHARAKLRLYAERQARQRFSDGKRVRLPFGPHLRAALNFLDNFLLRAAFLDGRGGWLMSRLYAKYTLDKYRLLKNQGTRSEPGSS